MYQVRRDYDNDKKILTELIRCRPSDVPKAPIPHYLQQIISIARRDETVFNLNLEDVGEHDPALLESILGNTQRYVNIVYEIVDELVWEFQPENPVVKDTLDIFIQHRILVEANSQQIQNIDNETMSKLVKKYPPELLRRYQLFFTPPKSFDSKLIREIKASSIGHMISVKAVVTKISDVKMMMQVATYTCDVCACESYQIVNSIVFSPLAKCTSQECVTNKAGGHLQLQTRGSKMVKFQEIKVQELASEVPTGCIPKSLTISLVGVHCRTIKPGDHVSASGVLFPTSTDVMSRIASGSKARGASALSCDIYLQPHTIKILNKLDGADVNVVDLTDSELAAITQDNFYEKLACSIAPEIYGHNDLKKALLLLLIGGSSIHANQMHIRGDIHICLMGDPGVAKSQLLGFVSRLSPRSQIVSGQGSSGVGLTASIVKDSLSGESTLQGGALVLSDGGLCCIDEFDKMSEHDRTAIHEVMEQQTVSIAKAGINAILNARTSILAAANPAYGRYDPKKSLSLNINLPSALLSRFDLLWLLQDTSQKESDLKLAEHVLFVHKNSVHPPLRFEPINVGLMKKYIAYAKQKKATIPLGLTEMVVERYVEIRKEGRVAKNTTFLSARSLLSILRLSTALAKLRLAEEVSQEDIIEAFRLVECSQESLKASENSRSRDRSKKNPTQQIFEIIKEMFDESGSSKLIVSKLNERCIMRGFRQDQITSCVQEYADLNVLLLNSNSTEITMI